MKNQHDANGQNQKSEYQPKIWEVDESETKPCQAAPKQEPAKWYFRPIFPKIKWKEVGEVLALVTGLAVAAIYGRQLLVMSGQLDQMEESSTQTYQLIADASSQARSAHSFSESATNIDTGIGTAVHKLNLQANELGKSVKQASRLADDTEKANANVIASDRPWIGGSISVADFEIGKTPSYTVILINSGKRPAKITLAQYLSVPRDYGNNPIYKAYDTTPSVMVIVPGQQFGSNWKEKDDALLTPIYKAFMDGLKAGTIDFRVYVSVEYSDLRTDDKYWTHLCWRYNPSFVNTSFAFSNCNEYNDAK